MKRHDVRIITYRGPAGDHNDRAMAAVADLGAALERALDVAGTIVGTPVGPRPAPWDVELERCREPFRELAGRVDAACAAGAAPVIAMTRCAAALATQPAVLSHHPDAVVVWFDAHGDINVPGDSATGYLGGMALSGPMGWWESGLGAGLDASRAVLVGARDLDPAERARLERGAPALVAPGPDLADRLLDAVAGRPAYVHLDCDVLEPGVVATDYAVPGGLTLDDLAACAAALGALEVVGVEIAEYEGEAAASAGDLVTTIVPVLDRG